jgi:hypothetical protein
VEGILKKNLPVLGANLHSYEQQIRSAFRRRDRVSLNHRTAAWLASYFDVLFAANRRFNPGEKRLLVHVQVLPAVPEAVAVDVEAACTAVLQLLAGSKGACVTCMNQRSKPNTDAMRAFSGTAPQSDELPNAWPLRSMWIAS